MLERSLDDILHTGEDSFYEFKQALPKKELEFAAEMTAFANACGGWVLLDIEDKGKGVIGIAPEKLEETKQRIASIARDKVIAPLQPDIQAIHYQGKTIIVLRIQASNNKPHMTRDGKYWLRVATSKQLMTPPELERMLQQYARINIDEGLSQAAIADSLDKVMFSAFLDQTTGDSLAELDLSEQQLLNNMNLAKGEYFNLAGLLLFARQPQTYSPDCLIRAVSFYGNDIADDRYMSRADMVGNILLVYQGAMAFLKSHLRQKPSTPGFNAQPELEISETALQEAIVNALLHRDYGKRAVIRLLLFQDRLELVSPGSLPNHLTVENIRYGNSVIRNPILVSHAIKLLPYSGMGSGIKRIEKHHKATEFFNDKSGEEFKVVFYRQK